MTPIIRTLRPEDRAHVMAMSDRLTEGVAAWRDHDAVCRAVLKWLDESSSSEFEGHAVVAEVDSNIAGFISVNTTTHFAGEVDGYIGELVVDRRYEGTGIGTALVRSAEALAVDAGHRCLTLTTGAANDRAIGFYERLGFRPEDIKLTMVLSPD